MARELKFRLRNFQNKIVGYSKWYEGAYNTNTGECTSNPQWLFSTNNKDWDATPIDHRYKDQSTGIFSHGKREMFEGDILKDPLDDEILVMKYDNAGFYADSVHTKGCLMFAEMQDLVIIGNIYNNPNLLIKKEGVEDEWK